MRIHSKYPQLGLSAAFHVEPYQMPWCNQCMFDYTKSFDKVQHEKLLKDLEGLDLDGKDLRLVRNLSWEQAACMRVDNELSTYI